MFHNSIVEWCCRPSRQDGLVKVTLGPLVQHVLMSQSLKLDGCHCWQYLGSHVLGKPPVIIFTHQNQHFFSFLRLNMWIGCLLSSLVVWFLLLLCQVFLVGHATVTAVLDGSWLGFIYYVGCEVCQSWCEVQVSAFVAVSVLSHGPNPGSSSINKVTNFLVKGFYWNRFQVSSQTSFQAFLQTKTFTSRLWTFVQQLD